MKRNMCFKKLQNEIPTKQIGNDMGMDQMRFACQSHVSFIYVKSLLHVHIHEVPSIKSKMWIFFSLHLSLVYGLNEI